MKTDIFKISAADYSYQRENHGGFCTNCFEFTHETSEPDAENYRCPVCERNTVQGAENALIAGLIEITDEENIEESGLLGPTLLELKRQLIVTHRDFCCPVTGEILDVSRVHIVKLVTGSKPDLVSHAGWEQLKPDVKAKLKIITNPDEL